MGSALTAWLKGLDADRLATVLAARPEVMRAPEPRNLGELAQRLQHPALVQAALQRVPLPCLQAAEALRVLGARPTRQRLAEFLGDTSLDEALRLLSDHALVWPDDTGVLHAATSLAGTWPMPLGLSPPLVELISWLSTEDLRRALVAIGIAPGKSKGDRQAALLSHHDDPDRVRALVAKAPRATRELLESHANGLVLPDPQTGDVMEWALDRALLVSDPHPFGFVEMPAEVTIALRGPDWRAPFTRTPPQPELIEVRRADVDNAAAAAASSFVAVAAAVLAECSRQSFAILRSGGIGAREMTRIGKAVQADDRSVRLVLETAHEAGLLVTGPGYVTVGADYGKWAGQEPAERLTWLQNAWWELGWTPSESRDESGKTRHALASHQSCTSCLETRRGVVRGAAELPAERGLKVPTELGLVASWYRPFAHASADDDTPFSTVIAEAELLGVLAMGACSSFGAALNAGDQTALASHAARLLPPTTTTARLGTDLTAVVSGTPSTALASLLQATADRESRSAASVWRFSNASIRRALDNGYSPADIEADLLKISSGPLPQPLSYLIKDVARRHGNVRVSGATCVVHSADAALIAELAADRKLAKFGLRQLAPTVLVSRKSIAQTLAALRAAGYSPLGERADGTVQVERAATRWSDYADTYEPPARRRKPQPTDRHQLAKALLATP